MATYILVQSNFESVLSGTDSLLNIDNRLNNINKAIEARSYIKSLEKIKPNLKNEVVYIAPFNSSIYENGKYLYKKLLIKIKN
jgi:hypothetical protein